MSQKNRASMPSFRAALSGRAGRGAPLRLYMPVPAARCRPGQLLPQAGAGRETAGLACLIQALSEGQQCQITPAARFALTEDFFRLAAPAVVAALTNWSQAVPRHGELEQLIQLLSRLAIGYKLAFAAHHREVGEGQTGAAAGLAASGVRILEVLRLELLVRTRQYKKPPACAWRDSHQVYFALRDHSAADHTFGLAAPLPFASLAPRADATALYLHLQGLGLMDLTAWPAHFIPALCTLLGRTPGSLLAAAAPAADHRRKLAWLAPALEAPPALHPGGEVHGRGLWLDMQRLHEEVHEDRARLISGNLPPGHLPGLGDHEGLSFLDLCARKLARTDRRARRRTTPAGRRLALNTGFDAVHHRWRHTATAMALTGDLVDQSSSGLRLFLRELRSPLPAVGALLSWEGPDDCAGLGYVVHLKTLEEGTLMGVARLARDIHPVTVQDLDAQRPELLPGFLLLPAPGAPRLLCHNRHHFIPGERLAVYHDGRCRPAALGHIELSQAEFSAFAVHLADHP